MEQTSRAGALGIIKSRAVRALILIVLTFLVSRVPFIGGCFPAAVALIAYLVSRNTLNIYLALPAAAGILPYITRGYDPWGDVAALCVCGILFVAARKIKTELWQRALIAAAITIICTSIYRLATATVYKMTLESLLFEGLLVFCMMFLFDAFYKIADPEATAEPRAKAELSLTALTVVCLLTVGGAGLGFLLWAVIVFLALCAVNYLETGQALFPVVVAGVIAALMDQAQWGFLVTLLIGATAASFAKGYGTVVTTLFFAAVCWVLKSAESGVVLGIDNYCLLMAAVGFLAINWKFGSKIRKVLGAFAGNGAAVLDEKRAFTDQLLRVRASDMEDLAELYATYLDSRSMLANQFNITRQIIDDARARIGESGRRALRQPREKFRVAIAVSQCAATGAINGDCSGWQDIGDGRMALVISDGMGKGKKAAAESLMVIKTIMALLKSGVTTDLTLKMINTIMLMKDDEDFFATVDLIIIDKTTGKTKFYKIGAAPTLIRRKSNVEEVKLSAVPLGIVNGLKIRYVETTLRKDDWIIMMSDGVSDGG
ncbi:MAG: SpoIIE family protein phosphatase, partial [Bacillota bacterium]|nr:SpoIIE family protein phosphatase [Bacillota bacterium]